MGQRHQAFLIARVIRKPGETEAKYRCIAAIHHQWCYGKLPLKAVHRFALLAKQKNNARIIREELLAYQSKNAKTPCPFASFLLQSAWTTELSAKPYVSDAIRLSATMGSTQGDNNDGITVIDVTDPENIAYCFIAIHGLESDGEVPDMQPFNATTYLRSYFPELDESELSEKEKKSERKEEQANIKAIENLKGLPLVTLQALSEAWPREYRTTEPPDNASQSEPDVVSSIIPSLVCLSVGPSIEQALKTGEFDDLEHLLSLPDARPLILPTLQKQDALPPHAVGFLIKVLEAGLETPLRLDLSRLALAPDQIYQVLDAFKDVEELDLSQNSEVNKDTLFQLITRYTGIRRFTLFRTSISNNDLKELLTDHPKSFYNIQRILHPLLLTPFREVPSAFGFVGSTSLSTGITSLPMFTTDQLIQGLTDVIHIARLERDAPEGFMAFMDAPLTTSAAAAAFSSTNRKSTDDWNTREVHIVPQKTMRSLKMCEGYNFLFDQQFYGPVQYGILYWTPKSEDSAEGTGTASEAKENEPIPHIVDFTTFLKLLEAEGRPAPSDRGAVDALSKVIKANFKLMTIEEYTQGLYVKLVMYDNF